MSDTKTFEVDGEEYTFLTDDDLTFGEARAIERTSGVKFSDEDGRSSVEFIQAMVWASMKRKQPTLSYSEVDNIPMKVLNSLVGDDDDEVAEEDPTPAADVEVAEPSTLTAGAL